MSQGKEKYFLTPRGLISLGVLIFSLIFMALLNGAILEEGVPDNYSAFISTAFSILPFALILSWVSFTWKWPNIFWLMLPLSLAIFFFVMLYSLFWRPEIVTDEGQAKYKIIYENVRKASPQIWGCENGWTVARMNVNKTGNSGKLVLYKYVLLSNQMELPPYGLATKYSDGSLLRANYSDPEIERRVLDNLKSCYSEELRPVKALFYPQIKE